MFCEECGSPISAGALFCEECGCKIASISEAQNNNQINNNKKECINPKPTKIKELMEKKLMK